MSELSDGSSRKNVTEEIGDEYKNWVGGNRVLINAPTGSGKTYFILHVLLPYVIEENIKKQEAFERQEKMFMWVPQFQMQQQQTKPCDKILYLVNRKILQNQIVSELKESVARELYQKFGKPIDIDKYITVLTYQSVEQLLKNLPFNNDQNNWFNWLDTFSYAVFDECHYFASDSTYNTYTELSYVFLRERFANKIQIFISATMECVREKILNTKAYNQFINIGNMVLPDCGKRYEYRVEKDYSYIDAIHMFNDMEQLETTIRESICSTNKKWLIFVDSIESGKKLKSALIKKVGDYNIDVENNSKRLTGGQIRTEDIVFIDAKYKKDIDASESVAELTDNQIISKKVIITTSVMDNGISIQDADLQNIVIFADTEEEFIQMLGRKRKGQDKVELYILKRDVTFFRSRYDYSQRIVDIYSHYYNHFSWGLGDKVLYEYFIQPIIPKPNYQQSMLEAIMENPDVYKYFTRFSYPFRGCLFANSFAVDRWFMLNCYYNELVKELGKDPDAFLKMQLSWLGITGDKAEKIIEECNISDFERYVRRIEAVVTKWLDKDILGDEVQESFRQDFYKDAICLVKKFGKQIDNIKTCTGQLGKAGTTVSVNNFNLVMEIAGLNYEMHKDKGKDKPYIISRK